MTHVGLRARLGGGLRERALRVGSPNLDPAVRVVVVLGHVVAALLCVMVATGWRGPAVPNTITGDTYRPWQALVTVVALGLVTAAVSIGAVRAAPLARLGLSATAVVLSFLTLAPLPDGPAHGWLVALGSACTAAALGLPSGSNVREVARCALVGVAPALAFVATLRSSEVDQALTALRSRGLAPSAAILLSLLAVFALASSVQEQRERSARLLAWRVTRRAVLAAAALKLALLATLYLHVTGGFLGGEAFWRPRLDRPLSWVHAAVVAVLIVVVAVQTRRQPLVAGDFTPRLGAVALGVGLMELAALATLVAVTIVSTLLPTTDTNPLFAFPNWVIEHVEPLQLVAGGAILVAAVAETAVRRRLTAGLYLWLAAGVWLVPALLGIAFASGATPTAWAAPGQVETLITLAVVVMAATRRPADLDSRALMLLVVVPLVVLHADSFWPDAWTDHLTQVAVIAAVVIALWLNPPHAYAARRRNERSRALVMAGQLGLLTLYLYLFDDAQQSGLLGSTTTIAWLWLGIPVTAVLTARITRAETH